MINSAVVRFFTNRSIDACIWENIQFEEQQSRADERRRQALEARLAARAKTKEARAKPTFAGFAAPPKNVMLETPDQIKAQAPAIYQQSVVTKAMPIGNLTNITDAERALIAAWFTQGAKVD